MDDLELMARLNATLGTRIRRIITYFGEPRTVVFDTELGLFQVTSITDLTALRKACLKETGHQIPYLKKEVWEVACAAIARLSYSFDYMTNPYRRHIDPEIFIAGYLALHQATEVPGVVRGIDKPFILRRRTYIPRGHFEAWHRRFRARKAKSADIWAVLRARGWTEFTEKVRGDDVRRPCTYWVSPKKWRPDANRQYIKIP